MASRLSAPEPINVLWWLAVGPSHGKAHWLNSARLALARLAGLACCLFRVLIAGGAIGGAGWLWFGRALPTVAFGLVAVAGASWWWIRVEKAHAVGRTAPARSMQRRVNVVPHDGSPLHRAVAGSLVWAMVVDKFRPDRWEITGAVICLLGVAVLMYAPRAT